MARAEAGERLGFLLRRAQQAHLALWNEIVSTDVTSVQFGALSLIDAESGLSQAELGRELDLDRSTIADVVARLERRGLVERSRAEDDRRRYRLRLTPGGQACLLELAPLVERMDAALTTQLSTAEREALQRALQSLLGGRTG
ncbi:DNA-binding MarR family transcriptional regulator [Okibacterium sp. HSC-33S16]|uniref:MarR family winged helix-turn-helix transcriptional regulator n=1 Tax=Okibacterium sp. HSC-33S16 TaxID=2910965 RepID=UPI00209D5B4F|nr:MarR family winged helix-turn-helix transcriptional regulator [Okibacterium sp. HSC-33S16]MCP2032496.1 DNA-binding MarR family transcriptional regulator [Okibacterium sp. HSC-33S16]